MRRKDFINKIRGISKKDNEVLAKKGLEKVEEIVENTDEDPIKTAAQAVYEFYQKLPKKLSPEEKGDFVSEFTNLLLKSDNVEKNEEVAVEFINTMLKEDEIPSEYVLNSAKELPDETLTQLTEEDEISIADRRKLISAMDDEEIKKEQLEKLNKEEEKRARKTLQRERKRLQKIYNDCIQETADKDIVAQIENAIKGIKYLSLEEINKMKARIIAKKMAQNYKRFGSSKMKLLLQIMSAKDMRDAGIIDLVEEEYIKLSNGKESEFSKKADLDRRLKKEIQEDYSKYNEESELAIIKEILSRFPKEKRIETIEQIKSIVEDKEKDIKNGIKVQGESR